MSTHDQLNTEKNDREAKKYTRAEFVKLSGRAIFGLSILSLIPFGSSFLRNNEAYGQRPYGE